MSRFTIPADRELHAFVFRGPVLHAVPDGTEGVIFWAETGTDDPVYLDAERVFTLVCDGDEIPEQGSWASSCLNTLGAAWHMYEIEEKAPDPQPEIPQPSATETGGWTSGGMSLTSSAVYGWPPGGSGGGYSTGGYIHPASVTVTSSTTAPGEYMLCPHCRYVYPAAAAYAACPGCSKPSFPGGAGTAESME